MESWKDIKGYEGYYQISDDLRIKSLPRKVKHSTPNKYRTVSGQIFNGSVDNGGYIKFDLSKDGVVKTLRLHQLIAMTYIPNPNPNFYTHVNHMDGDNSNNWLLNLEWCTNRFNIIHGRLCQDNEVDYLFVRKMKAKKQRKNPYQATIRTSEGVKAKCFNNPLDAHRWAVQFLDPKDLLTYRFDPNNPSIPIEIDHWDTYIK
jgi:hypothetical protein